MPGSTQIYGLRYQELGDPPDGSGLGQNLAEDVEGELSRVDGELADHAAQLAPVGSVTLVKRSAVFSFPQSAITAVPWDVEERDDDGLHAAGSDALTVPASLDGRVVMVVMQSQWDGGSGGSWSFTGITLNGGLVAGQGHPTVVNNEGGSGNASWVGVVTAGDVVRGVVANNDSAGASVSSSGSAGTYLRLVVVG